MEFESLKNELIENVKPHSPCASEYKRALSATNEEELLKVIYDNIGWCSETKTVSNEYFAKFDPTIWVQWSAMSGEEQKANPKIEASEGYTKSIIMKEAWANAWGNWSEENRKEFTSLENFDAEIFKEITGITV